MNQPISFPKIRKFNPMILEHKRTHGHAPIMVFVAKRGCGKSTLIEDIVSFLSVPTAIVMSATEFSNGFYSKHIHPLYIYDEFRPDKIQKIFEEQTKKADAFVLKYPDKKFTDCPEQGILIIMDDLAFDAKMMKDPVMKQLFFNGRHFNITLVMSFQYLVAIPPAFRMNIDYLFVGRDISKEYIDKLYKLFFGIFDTVRDFKTVFRVATKDYGYLVLDKTTNSDLLSDNVFWYRGQVGHKYKIGDEHVWRALNDRMKPQKGS
jgi:hypothetical protein